LPETGHREAGSAAVAIHAGITVLFVDCRVAALLAMTVFEPVPVSAGHREAGLAVVAIHAGEHDCFVSRLGGILAMTAFGSVPVSACHREAGSAAVAIHAGITVLFVDCRVAALLAMTSVEVFVYFAASNPSRSSRAVTIASPPFGSRGH
jgi:hypothetical protein